MGFILEKIEEAIKELLIGWIESNMTNMFTDVNAVLERFPEKFLVAASGMAGLGSANAITTRRVSRRFYLCGDGVSDVADGLGLVASRVAVCAGHQAHMVLRLLAEEYEP